MDRADKWSLSSRLTQNIRAHCRTDSMVDNSESLPEVSHGPLVVVKPRSPPINSNQPLEAQILSLQTKVIELTVLVTQQEQLLQSFIRSTHRIVTVTGGIGNGSVKSTELTLRVKVLVQQLNCPVINLPGMQSESLVISWINTNLKSIEYGELLLLGFNPNESVTIAKVPIEQNNEISSIKLDPIIFEKIKFPCLIRLSN